MIKKIKKKVSENGFKFLSFIYLILSDVLTSSLYMLLFQGFMFYTLKIKEYNMGMFVETATFVGTFFMIASNFFVQKTLRSFFIINLQMEN
jgi:hypothetical protein